MNKLKSIHASLAMVLVILCLASCQLRGQKQQETEVIILSVNAYSFADLLTAKDNRNKEQVYTLFNLLDWCAVQNIKAVDPTGYFFPTYPEVPSDEYLEKFNMDTPRDIAKSLAVYSGFTEGVQLFSSFAILLNFPRHNLMKNMGQVVSWSIRDENLHVEGMTKLFRTYIEENPELWDDSLKSCLYSIAERIVELEDAFIDTCFDGVTLEDLQPEDVKGYIRFIASRRLNQLGLKDIFGVTTNPLPWVDAMINGVEHTNFFENRPTEYAKAATTGNWDDIF